MEIYESEDLWQRISKNGAAKTRATYSIDAAKEQLSRLVSEEHIRAAKSQFQDENTEPTQATAQELQHGVAR